MLSTQPEAEKQYERGSGHGDCGYPSAFFIGNEAGDKLTYRTADGIKEKSRGYLVDAYAFGRLLESIKKAVAESGIRKILSVFIIIVELLYIIGLTN